MVSDPDAVSVVDAAGLPVTGVTALQALETYHQHQFDGTGGIGANILITAASGGVGTYAPSSSPNSGTTTSPPHVVPAT